MNDLTKNTELVDIRDISVDKSLPPFERLLEYILQIRDPHHFKCGKFTVWAKYDENGAAIEDCLLSLFTLGGCPR